MSDIFFSLVPILGMAPLVILPRHGDPKGNSSEKIENQSVFDGSPLRGATVSRQDDERGANRKLTDFQNVTYVEHGTN